MSTENAETGLLLAFEGGDGTGKTTLVKAVQKAMTERIDKIDTCFTASERRVHVQAFPTREGEVGKLIRRVFAEPQLVDRRSMLWLFAADGMDRQGQISWWLQAGDHVLLDRSPLISAWAYQTDEHPIEQIILVAPFFGLVPHLTFLLDCPASEMAERINQRISTEGGEQRNPLYESGGMEHLDKIRKRLLAYAALHDNVLILDATQPIESNVAAVLIAIDAFLKARS
jgi:dTMP kinase